MPKARSALTPIQQEVFSFIVAYRQKRGYPPTRQEIIDGFGWKSPTSAQQHLREIQRKGYVRLIDNISRGIEIL